ncbi:MAG: hypothetical protein ACTSUE_27105 [Promethearchaeota archaeon]
MGDLVLSSFKVKKAAISRAVREFFSDKFETHDIFVKYTGKTAGNGFEAKFRVNREAPDDAGEGEGEGKAKLVEMVMKRLRKVWERLDGVGDLVNLTISIGLTLGYFKENSIEVMIEEKTI